MLSFDFVTGAVLVIIQLAGIGFAFQAVLISRTPQASIAWVFALVVMPIVAIPLFLIFGESRFSGYVHAGEQKVPELDRVLEKARSELAPFTTSLGSKYRDYTTLAEMLIGLAPTSGNEVRLLVDGDATFDAIAKGIAEAEEFVLFQFFIVHDDEIGRRMKSCLLEARRRGVRVLMLVDQVGSRKLPRDYRAELMSAGVEFHSFVTNRQRGNRFRLNFRNHRKLVVVDGTSAFLGGLNVGDEYMGKDPRFGPWRDTFVRIEGPAARALQMPFIEDWFFTTGVVPDLPWDVRFSGGPCSIATIPGGPARTWNSVPAAYFDAIRAARKRLWFASPYFVPDQALRSAIGHAALRGLDVRLLLPQNPDHLLPYLSSFTFYPAMREAGVRIYRYQPGFMHQKVLLADDDLAIIGSANTDCRSFMINFELSAAVTDPAFVESVHRMFLADFERSLPDDLYAFENRGLIFRLKCRCASLLSSQQ